MKRQIILYGAGEMGKRAFEYYTKDDPDAVFCFADTFKGGTEYLGKPVLSLEDFLSVHTDYDVVLSIFDLFETATVFDKADVNYVVWDDDIEVPFEERIAEDYFSRLRLIEPQNTQPKILYGAGKFGRLALEFYGKDSVFAFADRNKKGSSYSEKPVIAPEELIELEDKNDIVVCVAKSEDAVNSLQSAGIQRFRRWNVCDDLRMMDYSNKKGTVFDDNIINEIKELDFITNPDYIDDYRSLYMKHIRSSIGPKVHEKTISSMSYGENKLYGFNSEMQKYAERNVAYFEGPAVSHYIWMDEKVQFVLYTQNIMNAGSKMKPLVHSKNRDCLYFTCGAYLHYTEPFYSDELFETYKTKLGRNLLVFPVHSLPYTTVDYDYRKFVEFALSDAKLFDSVTVCVYYNDYHSDLTRLFRANGANIVSCGLTYDPSFSRRLKTIISAADAVLTNGIGSHIFYCLGMSKPIKYYSQKIILSSIVDPKDSASIFSSDEYFSINLPADKYSVTQEILNAFDDICSFSKTKSKDEMAAIFDLSKRIVEECDYKRSEYSRAIRKTYRELRDAISDNDRLQFRLMKEALPSDYEK